MKTLLEDELVGDPRLVQLCLQGDRDAFAQIVARYQSVICAIAYSTCGDVGRSEDLAQETFIAAWRQLGELREPWKLKSWLCGIARNVVNNSARKQERVPTARAGELSAETCSEAANPQEMAISNEEEALMWRALEAMPPDYREPMVLFYREGQSVEKVAAALDLSEEAVRQRLSRGRVMLNERVTKTVERALFRSGPGKVFTLAVLAALPAFAVSASAATMGSAAVKGGSTAKAAATLGLAGALMAPLLAFFGTYIGYRLSMETAGSPQAREYIRKFYRVLAICMAMFGAAILWLVVERQYLARSNPALFAELFIGLMIAYAITIGGLILGGENPEKGAERIGEPGSQATGVHTAFEYRSSMSLLGLPLVHIRFGCEPVARRKAVKAWICGGRCGNRRILCIRRVAIAPVSFGGLGLGLITFSGFALGIISMGGFAVGIWALGGSAAGLMAFGGCAVGWKAAMGGIAVAREYALGGIALAAHANDAAASAYDHRTRFFPAATAVINYVWYLNLLWCAPLIVLWWVMRKKRLAGQKVA